MNDDQSLRRALEALYYRRVIIPPPLSLYRPRWVRDGDNWEMFVGNRSVARIIPIDDENFLDIPWLSVIEGDEFPDHGWSAVDFDTLENAQHALEQWWCHMCRGERYRGTNNRD
jgi:hypothetical protein